MADFIEDLEKQCFMNMQKDLCETCEGTRFMRRYVASRGTINELSNRVLSVISESDLSTAEAIGFMQYMKHVILNRSCIPQAKEHE